MNRTSNFIMARFYSVFATITTCLFSFPSAAQLPPVTFPGGTNVCDNASWKLVFYDEFEGSSINTNNWYTFNTNGGYTNDDWCQGRIPYAGNHSVIQDQNAVVNNGTLKLKLKQETKSWTCTTCPTNTCTDFPLPYTKNYTSGYISSKMTYNNGRIETRLKMPLFKYSWATCWTWYQTSVNEIDFVEAWGGSNGYNWPHLGDRPRNTYNLHAWKPTPNPYGLPNVMS